MLKNVLAALLLASVSHAAFGSVVFTIEGTAQSNALGYTTGQFVRFTMQLDDLGAAAANGVATPERLYWEDELSSHPNMWANIVVTGQTGSYQKPAGDDAYNFIEVTPASIYLWASTSGTNLGFSLGGQPIREVQSYVLPVGAAFPMPGTLPDPNVYFAANTGTYTSFAGGGSTYLASATENLGIDVTSFTIAPVPEPAIHAGLVAVAGLVLVSVRHMRRQNRS